jgi:hypothetical protein
LANFYFDTPDDATNNQTIFDLCACVLKHIVDIRSHSVPYASFQLLNIVVFDLVGKVKNDFNHTMPGGWIGIGATSTWSPSHRT